MDRKINFYELGKWDAIEEKDQVIWVLDHMAKQTHKNHRSTFWMNMRNQYKSKLLKIQAYEILAFIESHISEAQEKRRAYYLKKQKEKSELEIKAYKRSAEKHKMLAELWKHITPN